MFKRSKHTNSGTTREKTSFEKLVNRGYAGCIIASFIIFLLVLIFGQNCLQKGVLNIITQNSSIDSAGFRRLLCSEKGFIGSAVWTLTTILSAFVAFYYSALSYRNYGMANRQVIACTYGTCFIPGLVSFNAAVVGIMTVTYYIDWNTGFYLSAAYSFFLQAILICLCVYATTQYNAFHTILRIERKQFLNLYKQAASGTDRQRKTLFFMKQILDSEEIFQEKRGIISSILLIPFEKDYGFCSDNYAILFERQYKNFGALAEYVSADPNISSEIYDMLYEVMNRLNHTVFCGENGKQRLQKMNVSVTYSALFHAFLSQRNVQNKWSFFLYLINTVVENSKLRKELVLLLLISIRYMIRAEKIDIEDTDEIREMEKCFRQITVDEKFEEYIGKIYRLHENEQTVQAQNIRIILQVICNRTSLDRKKQFEMVYETEQCLQENGDITESLIHYLIHRCLGGK